MNKKMIISIGVCSALILSGLSFFGFELYTYNSKLRQLCEVKEQIIQTQKLLISNNEEIAKKYKVLLNDNNDIIALLEEENSDYIEHIEELGDIIDKITAETYFYSDDITKQSKATEIHMKKALKGTALYELADAYIEAESIYGVNAYALAAITALESNWGESDRSINDNNLTGFAVYSDSSEGRTFSSKEECILETAKLLKNDYLTPGGKSYSGLSVEAINEKYCYLQDGSGPDYSWHRKIISIATDLKNKANLGVKL